VAVSDRAERMTMARVVIVCGYDRFLDLDAYSEQVAARLKGERFDAIVVSGGVTNATSDRSEASMMAAVLNSAMPQSRVILEEFAMTTLDNLVFSRDLAAERFGKIDHYVICCDLAHRVKVAVLARLVLGRRTEVRAVPRSVRWLVRAVEPFSIVLESVAALIPPLRRAISRGAAHLKGVSPRGPRSIQREAA
jgi:hypothetical protein